MIPKLQPSQKSFLQILGGKEGLSKGQHLPIQEKVVLSIPERVACTALGCKVWIKIGTMVINTRGWGKSDWVAIIVSRRLNSSKIQKQRNSCHLISPSACRTRKNLKTPHTSFFAQNKVCPNLPILHFITLLKRGGGSPCLKKMSYFVKCATNNEK